MNTIHQYDTSALSKSYTTKPVSQLLPCITSASLADWLRLDDDSDSLLQTLVIVSTEYIINALQIELCARVREVIYPNYPTVGSYNSGNLSHSTATPLYEITLPFAKLLSVDEVLLYGETMTAYSALDTMPASIRLNSFALGDSEKQAVKVTYTAGFGDICDVPETLKMACTMLAAYMYEHRGCSAKDAFLNSGAKEISMPYSQNVIAL